MARSSVVPAGAGRRPSGFPGAGRSGAVRSWALVLSMLAAAVATMLGIHSVGETVLRADTHATSSSIGGAAASHGVAAASTGSTDSTGPTSAGAIPQATSLSPLAPTNLGGDALALGCGVLLLLCAVAAAAALLRARRQPGVGGSVEPRTAPPALAVVGAASSAPSLIALGISRT